MRNYELERDIKLCKKFIKDETEELFNHIDTLISELESAEEENDRLDKEISELINEIEELKEQLNNNNQ